MAPIGSQDWQAFERSLYLPLDVTVEMDSTKIIPSLDWSKTVYQMKLVPIPPKKQRED